MNSGSSVMQSKTCAKCKTEKPVSEFYSCGVFTTGEKKYASRCKECERAYQKDYIKRGGRGERPVVGDPEDFLAVLDDLPKKGGAMPWNLEEAKGLVNFVRDWRFSTEPNKPALLGDLLKTFKRPGGKCTPFIALAILMELKKARKAGMTIEEYWPTRKYRYGNKILAGGKSSED